MAMDLFDLGDTPQELADDAGRCHLPLAVCEFHQRLAVPARSRSQEIVDAADRRAASR